MSERAKKEEIRDEKDGCFLNAKERERAAGVAGGGSCVRTIYISCILGESSTHIYWLEVSIHLLPLSRSLRVENKKRRSLHLSLSLSAPLPASTTAARGR